MLLVDKYRPSTLSECNLNVELSERLMSLADSDDFPHLLFYGPSGAGKKTRIHALIAQIFKVDKLHFKVEDRIVKVDTKTIEYNLTYSTYHVELNPSESRFNDRLLIQGVLKEIAHSQPLDLSGHSRSFKIVVINEADLLSMEAQAALRRTMEKYMVSCRLILCCQSLTRIISAVRSRCLCIRIPAPQIPIISDILCDVAVREGFELQRRMATKIAKESKRNIRRALLMLEVCKLQQYQFTNNQIVERPEYEIYIASIASDIIAAQTPKQLLSIRNKFYELLAHCIPPSEIMKVLVAELLDKLDAPLHATTVQEAAFYEHRITQGSQPIFHLEAFTASIMAKLKEYTVSKNKR